jgi:hypothetical protein
MNERDCDTIYDTLITILSEHNLLWIIDQVEEQLRSGRTIEREIETLTEVKPHALERGTSILRKGPKARFPVTVAYDSCERAEITIDAIQHALIDSIAMEQDLVEFLERQPNEISQIEFYEDDSNRPQRFISRIAIAERTQGSAQLHELLNQLREEIWK